MKKFRLSLTYLTATALAAGMMCLSTTTARSAGVEVHRLDGSSTQGQLIELSSQKLTLQKAEGETTAIDLKDVIRVTPKEVTSNADTTTENAAPEMAAQPHAIAQLTLADGSTLRLKGLEVSSRNADLQLVGGTELSLGKSLIKGVQLYADPTEANSSSVDPRQAQWQAILERHTSGDAIVLDREGNLTVQEVVIHALNDEGVKIQLDDITTTVNPAKLYGLLFFQRGSRAFPAPLCEVEMIDGSHLIAKSLKLATEEQLVVTTLSGTEIPLRLSAIRQLDYAAGNIQFLDELSPTRVTWTPVLKSGIDVAELSLVYAPRMNKSFEGGPLQLEEKGLPETYARGIAMHATSELLYDLPTGFRQLQLKVGVAPRNLATCTAKMQIVGDQKILFEKQFTGDTPPEEVTLNVADVRRLKIIVDAADGEDFGDVLHLCQARLLK